MPAVKWCTWAASRFWAECVGGIAGPSQPKDDGVQIGRTVGCGHTMRFCCGYVLTYAVTKMMCALGALTVEQ